MTSSRFQSLPRRALVALVAIPLIIWLTLEGGYAFFAFVAVISGVSLFEFYRLTEAKGAVPLKTVGIFFGFLVNVSFIYERTQVEVYRTFASMGFRLSMFSQGQFLLVVLLVFLLFVLLIELFRKKGSALQNAGATILGVLVISLFFGTLIFTRELYPYGFPVPKFLGTGFADSEQIVRINRGAAGRSSASSPRSGCAIRLRTSADSPSDGTGSSSGSARRSPGKGRCSGSPLRCSR